MRHLRTAFLETASLIVNLESSVGIAANYSLDGRGIGVLFLAELRDFTLLQSSPTLISSVYRGFFPQGKAAAA
jgi:hypothetical protein